MGVCIAQVWEKQRVYRQERSKAIALDKLRRRENSVRFRASVTACLILVCDFFEWTQRVAFIENVLGASR